MNKSREIFQNANGSLVEKSIGDFIFFVLHFHIFINKHVIFMKKEKALFGVILVFLTCYPWYRVSDQ